MVWLRWSDRANWERVDSMIQECRAQGCQMERDGFTRCETGKCIDQASKARIPAEPPPPPTAVVWSNDAGSGFEYAHCATPYGLSLPLQA